MKCRPLTTVLPASVAVLMGVAAVSAADAPRPNVIYVFTDQQHAGMMSCAGNPHLKTPAMDSLAQTGAVQTGLLRQPGLRALAWPC